MALAYDPNDAALRANPFPLYRRLRDEDPVHWSPSLKAWVITRYDDVRRVLLNREMSPDRLTPFFKALPGETQRTLAEIIHYLNQWLVFRNPPEHTRLRGLMNKAFTPAAIESLRGSIERIVELLLGRLKAGEPADLIESYAMQVPALVIMDMLGVPRDMLDRIKAWSDDMVVFIGTARGVPDKYQRAERGAREMSAYFRRLIEERRAEPRDDIMSALIAARDDDDRLSEDELVATCMLILFAGHETTTNLIGNALYMLLLHPEERARYLADPSLAQTAVEEFLRYDGPSNALVRIAACDLEFNGTAMKSGDRVFVMLNAANRDDRQFPEPDRFDLGRSPNRHLTFGQGIHFCLGAHLARLEAAIAVPALMRRFPDLRLASADAPEWVDTLVMRGLKRLPVLL